MVSRDGQSLIQEWKPENGKNISLASCNNYQCVCATGQELFYLELQSGAIKQMGWVNKLILVHYVS